MTRGQSPSSMLYLGGVFVQQCDVVCARLQAGTLVLSCVIPLMPRSLILKAQSDRTEVQ